MCDHHLVYVAAVAEIANSIHVKRVLALADCAGALLNLGDVGLLVHFARVAAQALFHKGSLLLRAACVNWQ